MNNSDELEEMRYHEQAREDYISELAAEHRDPYAYCGIEEDADEGAEAAA